MIGPGGVQGKRRFAPSGEAASPRLHLAFLGHVARFSGAEIELLRFVEAADAVRCTVLLAEDGPMAEALRGAGAEVEVLVLPERARGLKRTEIRAGRTQAAVALDVARYVGALRRRLRELRPDAVGSVSLKAGAYGALAARLSGLPFVWHLHDQIAPSYLARQAVRPMRALIGTLPSAVISPSRTTLDTVGWFRPGVRTEVVPHPIPMPSNPIPVRSSVQRIGIVGRLAPWKGQDVFLRAFARAVPEVDVHAVVVGSAIFGEEDYAAELRELAAELGVADRVQFTGFRQDVAAEFRKLDLLVHASVLTEPFGTVVFEAMAAGLPVIAARSGGVVEYIEHGRHALMHAPGDDRELGEMLRLALDDHELRRTLAQTGRELTRSFAPERIAARWIEIYQEVAARGRERR
ncbi:MAG: glycosyltransferase family 4 protein [Solirubrobacteraceae bacterium]